MNPAHDAGRGAVKPVAANSPGQPSQAPLTFYERPKHIPGHYYIKFNDAVMDNDPFLSTLVTELGGLGFSVQAPIMGGSNELRGLHHLKVDADNDEVMYAKLGQFCEKHIQYIVYCERSVALYFDQTPPK
jgi:hypothetical protein